MKRATMSEKGLAILRFCSGKGQVQPRLIIVRLYQGEQLSVAKASLSRTLRRLWKAGLVELHQYGYRTATSEQVHKEKRLAEIKANLVAEYEGLKGWIGPDRAAQYYGSPEAWIEFWERRWPNIRANYVEVTAKGMAAVNTRYGNTVNRGI